MSTKDFINLCKNKIVEYFNNNKDCTDKDKNISTDDVYVVWSCKTLLNHKALLSTTIPDGMYYELTYNGADNELYLDAYKKWKNISYKINED